MRTISLLLLSTLALLSSAEIVNKCNRAGLFAMTWDDGPGDYTSQLLETLSQKKVKATFHLTTQYLTDPNIQSMIQRISSAGHLIGLRTEPDWNLFQMSDDMIRAAIARSANTMANFIGYYPVFIRLPYKGWDDRVKKAVESTGAIITQHNLESYDYTGNADRIFNSFQLAITLKTPGSGNFISVQHDSTQASVGVAGKVIDLIRENGYELVTLDKCLGMGDMTKNKNPLKGADGVKLPPMSSEAGGAAPSGPSMGPGAGSPFGGNGKVGKAAANAAAPSAANAFFALVIASLAVVLAVF